MADVVSDPAVPAHAGDILIGFYGDPQYHHPVHTRIDLLPPDWARAITTAGAAEPIGPPETQNARWRRLLQEASGDQAAGDTSTHIVGPRRPHRRELDPHHLVRPRQRPLRRRGAARARHHPRRTHRPRRPQRPRRHLGPHITDDVFPLPEPSGPMRGFSEACTLRAAILGQTISNDPADIHVDRPLAGFMRSVLIDQPLEVAWSDLHDLAQS